MIPKPITQDASCHQLCINFENVRQQVNQPTLPIWCDEQVFDKMVDILLSNSEKFKDLFPCLGPFHMARILQKCAGKLLRGSGLDDLLIECGTFGQGVMETVLNGKHYYRSLAGLLIIEDLIVSIQWKAFFLTHDQQDYACVPRLQKLAEALAENKEQTKEFNEAITVIKPLKKGFTPSSRIVKLAQKYANILEFYCILFHLSRILLRLTGKVTGTFM